MRNYSGSRRTQRIRFGGLPVCLVDPGHPPITTDVPDGTHLELPEPEVAKVGIVGRARVHREKCGTGAAPAPFDARAWTEQRDAAVSQRVCGAVLRYQQRGARIPLQILRMFGESADEED